MTNTMVCQDSVNTVKGIGQKKAERLAVLGINTVGDLLNHFPCKYQDRRNAVLSNQATEDKAVLVEGELRRISSRTLRGRRIIVECTFRDAGGVYNAVFFNRPYLKQSLSIGKKYTIYGLVSCRRDIRVWTNPEITETGSKQDIRGIIPLYRCTQGITSNDFRRFIRQALETTDLDKEWMDTALMEKNKLFSRRQTYNSIHFPEGDRHYKAARFRIIYEQLLIYQLAIRFNRDELKKNNVDSSVLDVDIQPFIDNLPFELTNGQKSCIEQIEQDLIESRPMNRLVQGDVGCGKTVVAEAAIYKCAKSGYQSIMMAPTEILARQHYERLKDDFKHYDISCCLLVSGMKVSERRAILASIADGSIDVVVGTHAVIQDDVRYCSPALVVTDEQHRFGVNQRKALVQKGRAVNVCVMSATPIPRTLALTVFGDMDFSVIRSKPADRKTIITKAMDSNNREYAYAHVKDELAAGHKAYVIAPSIDSEAEELSSVEALYTELSVRFKDFGVGMIHGRLDKDEKEAIMDDFATGNIKLLVATVVIEVGIDVPDATIIVLENSERYGLAQMHQLRGRVGRSDLQSYCYLINYSHSETAVARAKAMVEISDGFEISEEDYRLRGPGDVMGTMQSGNYQSVILSLCRYEDILKLAVQDAQVYKGDNPFENNMCESVVLKGIL